MMCFGKTRKPKAQPPAEIEAIAKVMSIYVEPAKVADQVDAIRNFYDGKISYAEMRMRAG
jgi:hypothetical protein